MAKTAAAVPATRSETLPAGLGGRQQVDVNTAECVIYEPVGLTMAQVGPDTWEFQYLISPFKMVAIRLDGDGKALLLSKMTGGIVIPT